MLSQDSDRRSLRERELRHAKGRAKVQNALQSVRTAFTAVEHDHNSRILPPSRVPPRCQIQALRARGEDRRGAGSADHLAWPAIGKTPALEATEGGSRSGMLGIDRCDQHFQQEVQVRAVLICASSSPRATSIDLIATWRGARPRSGRLRCIVHRARAAARTGLGRRLSSLLACRLPLATALAARKFPTISANLTVPSSAMYKTGAVAFYSV